MHLPFSKEYCSPKFEIVNTVKYDFRKLLSYLSNNNFITLNLHENEAIGSKSNKRGKLVHFFSKIMIHCVGPNEKYPVIPNLSWMVYSIDIHSSTIFLKFHFYMKFFDVDSLVRVVSSHDTFMTYSMEEQGRFK